MDDKEKHFFYFYFEMRDSGLMGGVDIGVPARNCNIDEMELWYCA